MYSPVRVLHIVSSMNMGGIENQIINWYRKLDRKYVQYDFLMLTEEKSLFDDEIIELGGRIYKVGKPNFQNMIPIYLKTSTIFSDGDYNIVHCHMNTWAGFFLTIAKKNKIPYRISHSHSSQNINGIKSNDETFKRVIKKIMKTQIKNAATHLWAAGSEAGEWLFDDEEFVVIPNARDFEKFKYSQQIRTEIRAELLIDEDTLLIGHIGSFSSVKNHRFLLEIIHKLKELNLKFKVILLGDGNLKDEIILLSQNLKIGDEILFLGNKKDVQGYLSAMDLFLLPSLFEGMPAVLIEAQIASLPSIVSKNISKEIHLAKEIPMEFLKIEDPTIWAEKILSMEKRNSREINSFHTNKDYNINEQMKFLMNFYNQVSEG